MIPVHKIRALPKPVRPTGTVPARHWFGCNEPKALMVRALSAPQTWRKVEIVGGFMTGPCGSHNVMCSCRDCRTMVLVNGQD